MALSLQKGGNISLSKAAPGLNKIIVGLGWNIRATDGADFDLDTSVFLLTEAGKVRSSADFIFYNQLKSACGSVEHTGDNQIGEGEGDDETINIALNTVPADVTKIAIAVTIHDAEKNGQNFGQVNSAFIRVINAVNNKEIARFDLSEEASTNTAMIFGELRRNRGEWEFCAVSQGFAGGLGALARSYGINI